MFQPLGGRLQGILLMVTGKYPAIFLSLTHVSPLSPLDSNSKHIASLSSAPLRVYLKIRLYITNLCGWESSVKYTVTSRNDKQTVHTRGVASVDVAYYGSKATI